MYELSCILLQSHNYNLDAISLYKGIYLHIVTVLWINITCICKNVRIDKREINTIGNNKRGEKSGRKFSELITEPSTEPL